MDFFLFRFDMTVQYWTELIRDIANFYKNIEHYLSNTHY